MIKSLHVNLISSTGYVSHEFVQTNPVITAASKYFVIQNVATETTRVYERCTTSPDCRSHKMIFEAEMVTGRSKGNEENEHAFKTGVGHYKLSRWVKFYEDNRRHYPSYYHPSYPPLPEDGGFNSWLDDDLLPADIREKARKEKYSAYRGAFGWYAAMTTPVDESQWLHGTYGRGYQGDKFLAYTRDFFANVFADPQSSGCTRLENAAIAYLRHILPEGTDIFRIYAIEATRPGYKFNYPKISELKPWSWILTTEDSQKVGGKTSDAAAVLARGAGALALEQGTYMIDQTPTPIGFMRPDPLFGRCRNASTGLSGNTYCLKEKHMQGVYLIDEGALFNYQHPADEKIKVGGFSATQVNLPDYLQAQAGIYDIAKPLADKQLNGKDMIETRGFRRSR